MLKRNKFILTTAAILIGLAALMHIVHYLIFQDIHHLMIFLVSDLAFLPLEVFFVVLVIERILTNREKQAMMQKMNMVVGAFFSEAGNPLLKELLGYFDNRDEISRHLSLHGNWTKKEFKEAAEYAHHLKIDVNLERLDLEKIKALLKQKRTFLITMLENPNLLEHDRFTDLLWAITHLDEELQARESLKDLPHTDLQHISGDIVRLYDNLASEWIS